ncbi:MAG: hypothetical protein QF805_19165, partial [Pirellulaceae bacterium]|nr:hypothetical protein [Pirellulaceae bacterium]
MVGLAALAECRFVGEQLHVSGDVIKMSIDSPTGEILQLQFTEPTTPTTTVSFPTGYLNRTCDQLESVPQWREYGRADHPISNLIMFASAEEMSDVWTTLKQGQARPFFQALARRGGFRFLDSLHSGTLPPETNEFDLSLDAQLYGIDHVQALFGVDVLTRRESWLWIAGRALALEGDSRALCWFDLVEHPAAGPLAASLGHSLCQHPQLQDRFRRRVLATATAARFEEDCEALLDRRTLLGTSIVAFLKTLGEADHPTLLAALRSAPEEHRDTLFTLAQAL